MLVTTRDVAGSSGLFGTDCVAKARRVADRLSGVLRAALSDTVPSDGAIVDPLVRYGRATRPWHEERKTGPDPEISRGSVAVRNAVAMAQSRGQRLKAFASVFTDQADAPRCEVESEGPGHLAGVPFAFKDVFSCPARVPQVGTGTDWPNLSAGHAEVIESLERAGAVAIGATNLDPWCYTTTGINPLVDSPIHPHDECRLVGGSSSGSAVAVAAGIVPFALGTDTGGSTRIPAALCGVYGLKPTNGLLSTRGVVPLSRTHDCVGVLARDVNLITAVLSTLVPHRPAPLNIARGAPVMGIWRNAFDECDTAVQGALAILERSSSMAVLTRINVALPELDLLNDVATVITAFEAFTALHQAIRDDTSAFPPQVIDRLAVGAMTSPTTYRCAQQLRADWFDIVIDALFGVADFVITPVTRVHAPRTLVTGNIDDDTLVRLNVDLLYFNRWVNLFGLPSLTVPIANPDGEPPAAVQIVGPPFSDFQLLELATRIDLDP